MKPEITRAIRFVSFSTDNMRLLLTQNSLFTAGDSSNKQLLLYNNINCPLDATIIILLTISISSTCFGR